MTTTKEETERRHYLEVLRIAEELQRALDEKTERLEKIERALEWAAARPKWARILTYAVDANIGRGEYHDGTGPSIANALIALHERAGK